MIKNKHITFNFYAVPSTLYLVLSTLYFLLSTQYTYAQYTLSKVAGSGVSLGFSGDGANANNALLYNPYATTIDKNGNVFIADYLNHRIRKIDKDGIITTVAGSSSIPGYSGDGALATNAVLNCPTSIAIDTTGNIYFTELKNNCVRKIDKNGIIFTYISNLLNPTAICIDKNQNLFVADYLNQQIKKIDKNGVLSVYAGTGSIGFSGDNGLAINAKFNYPEGVAVDVAGNVYVSDTQNRRIRKITTNGNIVTIAGNGTNGFSGDGSSALLAELSTPKGLACDTVGNIYFADADNNRIRRVDSNGNINTVLGEIGLLGSITLSLPIGVSCDRLGNIYVADTYNCAIRKLTAPPVIPIVEEPTKIEELSFLNDEFVVYPNPNNGIFTISIHNAEYSNFEIYNMYGQQIKTKLTLESNFKYSVDISDEASGLYFVHANKGEQKVVKKINIIKR